MNTKNNKKLNGSSKIVTLLIVGLCLLTPMMAVGLDSAKPDSMARCDMQIVKAVDSLIASPGSILTYTIQVKNQDNYDHKNVLVKDGIPVYTTYIQGSANNNGVYLSAYNQIEWKIDLLKAGTTIELSYEAQIDAGTPNLTEIRNTAKISLPIIVYSNLVITKVKVEAKPRLEIIKQVDKTTAFAEDTLHYTLTVSNNGDAKAYYTDIVDDIPEFTTYILGSTTNGTYNASFNRLSWYIEYLWPGESVVLNFSAIIDSDAPAQTQITNIGTIILDTGNLSDTVITTVLPDLTPKLNIIKEVDKSTAFAGDTLTYYLDISNYGDQMAENVDVTDNIPEHTTYIPGSAIGGNYDANLNQVSWDLSTVPLGIDVSMLQFKVAINELAPAPMTITNVGTVKYLDQSDSDDATTNVSAYVGPKLFIDKSVDKSSAYPGDTLTYYLDISNYGDQMAENADVTDNIPEHTTYVPGSAIGGNYDANLNQVSWDLDYVPQGYDVSMLQFKVAINELAPAPMTITNVGTVKYLDQSDSDDATTSVSTYVGPKLFIDKSVDKSSAYNGDTLTYYLDISNYGDQMAENVDVTDNIPEHTTFVPGSVSGASYDASLNQLTWNLSALYPGYTGSAYLRFDVVIDRSLSAPTTIVNVGEVTFEDQRDTDDARTDVSIHPGPKVYIDKSVNKSSAYNGDTLTYYLDVYNYGSEPAKNVKVTDNIPEHTTFVPGSASGASYDATLNQLTWNLSALYPGYTGSAYLRFDVVIDRSLSAPTTIVNVGEVTFEDQRDTDDARTGVSIHPGPKIYIDKSVDKSSAYPGDTLTYYLDISNYGGQTAENVDVTDNIPEHTTYIPGSAIGGNYDANLNQVNWDLDYVPQGYYVSMLQFKVAINELAPAPMTITNVGTVKYLDQSDSDDVKTSVSAYVGPKLFIEKSVDKSSAYPGDTLTYYLDISNYGDQMAENVDVTDNIPEHTTYIPGSAIGGNYDANLNQVSWDLQYVPPGMDVSMLQFMVVIDKRIPAPATIVNIGTVTYADQFDSDEARTDVSASPEARLYIEKRVDISSAYPGDTLTYTLIVWNGSEVTAENINVIDNIPEFTTYVSGTVFGGCYDAGLDQLSWTIGNLDSHQETYLSFRAVIDAGTTEQTVIRNVGTVTAPGIPDSDEVNTTVLAYPGPKLYIEKRVDETAAYVGDTLTYTLIVSNFSAIPAENVSVEDYIPDYTTYVPGTAFGGNYNGALELLTWTVDYIEATHPAYLSFRAVIDRDTPDNTDIINTGSVILADKKISDDVLTTVLPSLTSELTITKRVDKVTAYAGDTLTYTLDITNIGEETARNIKLEDYIPEYTVYALGSALNANYDANNNLLNWLIDYIEPGAMASRSFKVVIDSDTQAQTEIINTGSIVLPDGKKSDDAKTTVLSTPEPELNINKNVDKATAYAGDTLTYTVVVSNIGKVSVTNVEIEDFIPEYTTYIPGSSSDLTYDIGSRRLSWIIGILSYGEASTKSFKVVIDGSTPAQTEIENIGSILLPDESKLSDTANTIVQDKPVPKLDISKIVDLATAYAGDTLTYTISISNTGNVADEDVWVTDPIPQNATYIDGSVTGGGDFNTQTKTVNWNISIPAGGSSPDLTFKVTIDDATPVQTEIENIGSILFPDDSRLSDTANTIVQDKPAPKLDISKIVDLATAYAGETLTYTISVSNTGETDAEAIHVFDNIPENVTYVDGTVTNGGVYDTQANRIDWTVAVPAGGSSPDLTFKVTIDDATPVQTEIENIGSILFPDDSRLSDTVKTIVITDPSLNLDIIKNVDKPTAYAGETLTYTISVSNTGETDAEAIHVFDNIPQNATYVDGTVTNSGVYDTQVNRIDWTVAVPAGGLSPDLIFKVLIGKTTPDQTVIRNIGSILYPDETILSDTAQTVVKTGPSPNLDIIKDVDKTTAYAGDTLTYTISVSNNGDIADEAVWVTDPIPQNATYVIGSVTNGGIYDTQIGIIDWNISVPAGGLSPDLTFKVTIDEATPAQTEIENIGSILFPDDSRLSDTAQTIVLETLVPNIEVVKQVDSLIASPGSILTYSLEFTNIGNTPITQITAWDKLPEFTSYVDGSATAGGIYDETDNQINWNWQVGSIAPGHSIDLSFEVQIDGDTKQGAQITNFGSAALPVEQFFATKVNAVQYETLDTVHSNLVTTIVDIKTGEDDLTIFKEVSAVYTTPRNILTYYLTVTNSGNETLNNIVFADTIPTHTKYVPGSATGNAIYDGTNSSLTWTLSSLDRNQSVEYKFDVKVDVDAPDKTDISNQAFILEPATIDGNIVLTTILRERISVVKSVDKSQVTIGDTLTYMITYTNNSLADVDNFVIIDTLVPGLNYIPGSATSGGFYNSINESLIWRIRLVPAGGSGSISFGVEIDESVPNSDEIRNFVIFSGDDIPIDTSNLVIVTITFPEMVMSKTVDQIIALPGDTVTYTINAFNDGAGPLNNAVVIDTLPDNFEYVSGTATVNGASVAVTVTDILTIPIGTMGAAESAEIIYDVAILSTADRSILHVNSALLQGTNSSAQPLEFGPVQATVFLQTPQLSITKTADVTSSIAGSFVPFKITITNVANITIDDVIVTDSMSSGFFYVEGSSIIDGASANDPDGTNPYEWFIGDIAPGQTVLLQYMAQLGTSVSPGRAENTAWAAGRVGGGSVRTNNVIALVNVISTNIPGAIRGKILVDCDGDGIADSDLMPTGMDIYLDDGSNSRVNEKGMFYFGTVRAGEHLVALDIRDLKDYELAEGQDGSVLVYVHEAGESYVTFQICPAYPKLSITKEAAILPKIKVSKTAILSDSMITDSNSVIINYDILIESGIGVRPGEVVVVDSFPSEAQIVIHDGETRELADTGKVLRYTIGSPGQKHLTQSVYYSLDDLDFDTERFLTNNLYLESVVNIESKKSTPVKSSPVELSIGPFYSVSAGEIEMKMITAHFITAKAFIQDKDLPLIAGLADSISKYPGIDVKVEGHADYRRIHNDEFPSNWELSKARAKSVVDMFSKFHSIDSSIFTYEGFAATRPIDRGHTEASWWKNRRAEVILSGSVKGGIEFGGDLNQKWSQSTILELEPAQWDTLLLGTDSNSESELINTWEILITISNIGPGKASKVVIEDLLPIGAVYEEGSISVNGREVTAKLDEDNNLVIGSGDIPEGNSVEIRYRIRAAEKSTIIGGGKAVVEIEHRDIDVVRQESNPIRFY